jgi:very-short-patch-repair endonuclease
MPQFDWEDDGLDVDGYPIPRPGLRYRHGSEAEAGDWQPQKLAELAPDAIDRIRYLVELAPNCDSPIEAQLGAAILIFFKRAGLSIKLLPQFAWSYYRSDWAIITASGKTLLIECDGHDFHSSVDQLNHDATKDAAALEHGYQTIRFTGSEIHKIPDGCARAIFDRLCSL